MATLGYKPLQALFLYMDDGYIHLTQNQVYMEPLDSMS